MKFAFLMILAALIACTAFTACRQMSKPSGSSSVKQMERNIQESLPTVEILKLEPQNFQKSQHLPGELFPYETVDVYPKIEGFIQAIYVDRGSIVHRGQLLARLVAPEMQAQIAEARSNVQSAAAEQAEAKAKYMSDLGLYQRYKEAAQTPGVISENELATAQMAVQASLAKVKAVANTTWARQAKVQSLKQIQNYLQIIAPIDGVVVERQLHPGALVGSSAASDPIVRIQQLKRLRLVVAIPERYYSSVKLDIRIPFTVPAYPGKTFYGVISRPAYALDEKNRTETVELDVTNPNQSLSPGMYAEVQWSIFRPGLSFVVPATAVVSTTERTFVNRVIPAGPEKGKIAWVDIQRGYSSGDNIEVFGDLHPGDWIAVHGSDEFREGMTVNPTRLIK